MLWSSRDVLWTMGMTEFFIFGWTVHTFAHWNRICLLSSSLLFTLANKRSVQDTFSMKVTGDKINICPFVHLERRGTSEGKETRWRRRRYGVRWDELAVVWQKHQEVTTQSDLNHTETWDTTFYILTFYKCNLLPENIIIPSILWGSGVT